MMLRSDDDANILFQTCLSQPSVDTQVISDIGIASYRNIESMGQVNTNWFSFTSGKSLHLPIVHYTPDRFGRDTSLLLECDYLWRTLFPLQFYNVVTQFRQTRVLEFCLDR